LARQNLSTKDASAELAGRPAKAVAKPQPAAPQPAADKTAGPHWRQVIDAAASRSAEDERERRQNRSRQRSEEILSAAIRVFARQGVAKTRISDIAAEAGIPAPSLYGYYENKEELAYAIPIKRQIQFFAEYAKQSEKLPTVGEQLALFLWLTTDFARRNPDWAAVLYLEVWPSVLIKETRVRDVLDDYASIIIGLIREGAARGEWLEDPNPYETSAIFIGSISQLIITWLLYRKPRDLTRSSRAMIDRLMLLLTMPRPTRTAPNGNNGGRKAAEPALPGASEPEAPRPKRARRTAKA
jgi:AcrR family transcriptional regulator